MALCLHLAPEPIRPLKHNCLLLFLPSTCGLSSQISHGLAISHEINPMKKHNEQLPLRE